MTTTASVIVLYNSENCLNKEKTNNYDKIVFNNGGNFNDNQITRGWIPRATAAISCVAIRISWENQLKLNEIVFFWKKLRRMFVERPKWSLKRFRYMKFFHLCASFKFTFFFLTKIIVCYLQNPDNNNIEIISFNPLHILWSTKLWILRLLCAICTMCMKYCAKYKIHRTSRHCSLRPVEYFWFLQCLYWLLSNKK